MALAKEILRMTEGYKAGSFDKKNEDVDDELPDLVKYLSEFGRVVKTNVDGDVVEVYLKTRSSGLSVDDLKDMAKEVRGFGFMLDRIYADSPSVFMLAFEYIEEIL